MSKVSSNFFHCKHCGSEGFKDPDVPDYACPRCGGSLKTPQNDFYSTPNYLFFQRQRLLNKMEKDKLLPGDYSWMARFAEVENNFVTWSRECPENDRIAAMEDARHLLANIIYSSTSPDALKAIIKTAKHIGKLAESLESYFLNGGSRYDREVRPIRPDPGDGYGREASATAGGG